MGWLLLRSTQVQLQVEGRFGLYGVVEFLHSTLRFGGIAMLMILAKVLPSSVLACYAIAPGLILAIWLAGGARGLLSPPQIDWHRTVELLSCIRWYLLTFGLGALISRMDVFFLAKMSTLRETGIFTAAQTIAMIAQMIGTYLSVVTSPKIVPMLKEGRFFPYYRRFQSGIILLCLLGYLVFWMVWTAGGSRLLPGEYERAGNVLYFLMAGSLAGLATFPVTLTFIMFTHPRFLFVMDCACLPVLCLLYALIIPEYGAIGAAWITAGVHVSRAAIAQLMAWKWAAESSFNRSNYINVREAAAPHEIQG
jgi:O-antigen/teichoic acid export membrane protein